MTKEMKKKIADTAERIVRDIDASTKFRCSINYYHKYDSQTDVVIETYTRINRVVVNIVKRNYRREMYKISLSPNSSLYAYWLEYERNKGGKARFVVNNNAAEIKKLLFYIFKFLRVNNAKFQKYNQVDEAWNEHNFVQGFPSDDRTSFLTAFDAAEQQWDCKLSIMRKERHDAEIVDQNKRSVLYFLMDEGNYRKDRITWAAFDAVERASGDDLNAMYCICCNSMNELTHDDKAYFHSAILASIIGGYNWHVRSDKYESNRYGMRVTTEDNKDPYDVTSCIGKRYNLDVVNCEFLGRYIRCRNAQRLLQVMILIITELLMCDDEYASRCWPLRNVSWSQAGHMDYYENERREYVQNVEKEIAYAEYSAAECKALEDYSDHWSDDAEYNKVCKMYEFKFTTPPDDTLEHRSYLKDFDIAEAESERAAIEFIYKLHSSQQAFVETYKQLGEEFEWSLHDAQMKCDEDAIANTLEAQIDECWREEEEEAAILAGIDNHANYWNDFARGEAQWNDKLDRLRDNRIRQEAFEWMRKACPRVAAYFKNLENRLQFIEQLNVDYY